MYPAATHITIKCHPNREQKKPAFVQNIFCYFHEMGANKWELFESIAGNVLNVNSTPTFFYTRFIKVTYTVGNSFLLCAT